LDFVAYVRIYIRGRETIEDAQKELDRILADVDFSQDGLYDLSVCLADNL